MNKRVNLLLCAVATVVLGASAVARADVVTEWNVKGGELITAARPITQQASRMMALAHTAAYEAANAITRRYPGSNLIRLEAKPDASVEAAIGAAHCAVLGRTLSTQQAAIDAACKAALGKIADGAAKEAGIVAGQQAAALVLAARADDGADAPEAYRPTTTAGAYVPTTIPATTMWPQRKPWLLASASQFRPGAPPALTSERWARDYNEIKAIGGRASTLRSAEQTEIARFWETTLPPIYHGLVRSVAEMPGRDVMRNARLFAAVTQAIDDALIAVFDAKYHYGFWRPITAIRNGDIDGNDATERDASWLPLIDTPMHPEYPCAHCVSSGAVGAVLEAELGTSPMPRLSTKSPTANDAVREWTSVAAFMDEVQMARIYDGVHYRNSAVVGGELGRKVGALAMEKFGR